MNAIQRSLQWILIACSVTTLALGAFALRAEAEATALGSGSGQPRLSQFINMISDDVTIPLSVLGRRVLLDGCETLLQPSAPLVLRFASDKQRERVVPFCTRLAKNATTVAMTDSYAWLILALAQIRQGNLEAAATSLVWSGQTGPTESWIARSRFTLVQDHYGQLSPAAQAVGDADAILLIQTNRGSLVARRFMSDPAFRQRAEALIEMQPQSLQRTFIFLLQRHV
jgi:hypothetical protein